MLRSRFCPTTSCWPSSRLCAGPLSCKGPCAEGALVSVEVLAGACGGKALLSGFDVAGTLTAACELLLLLFLKVGIFCVKVTGLTG